MRKSNFVIALIVLLLPAVTAAGQTLEISDDDRTPTIIADLGSGNTSFSKTITLTLKGAAKADFTYQATDLRRTSDNDVIDRKHISLSPTSLIQDRPTDVAITVNRFAPFGKYTSEIKLFIGPTEATRRPITLTVDIKPKIEVKLRAKDTQLVRCSFLPCSFLRWLPDNGQDAGLILDNETAVGLSFDLHELFLVGDKSSIKLGDYKTQPLDLGAHKSGVYVFNFPDTNRLAPDSYTGTVRFGLKADSKDVDTQPSISYVLNVRDGPWWALVVLILGVVVGRLVNKLNSPEALVQLRLLKRAQRLEKRVLELPNSTDQARLQADLQRVKQRIDDSENETVLTQELDKIETRTNLLRQLEELLAEISRIQDPTLKQELGDMAEAARQAFRQGNLEDCLTKITAIETRLQQVQPSARGQNAAALARSVGDLKEEGRKALAAAMAVEPSPPSIMTRALAWAAGTKITSVELQNSLLRPLFFFLLLFLLVMVGLKTGYIDKPTFGSGKFYDYLGLFMWGLSADIAQKTLQNLSLPHGPA